jgi:ParB family chromosome partitioning protein
LEEAVQANKHTLTSSPPSTPDLDTTFLETQLAEHLGTPVQIVTDSHEGGWLNIKFFDNDTLSGLLERMGLRYD